MSPRAQLVLSAVVYPIQRFGAWTEDVCYSDLKPLVYLPRALWFVFFSVLLVDVAIATLT